MSLGYGGALAIVALGGIGGMIGKAATGQIVWVYALALVVGDVAWDPVRGVLYASVRATDTRFPNRVIALDPMTGAVQRSVIVGSDPIKLALSDDMSVLYVALDGAAAIRRVDLTTFTAGLQFPLVTYLGRILYADDMAVMPGNPGTVAVTHQVHGYSEGKGEGVAIYDNGVARPSVVPHLDGGEGHHRLALRLAALPVRHAAPDRSVHGGEAEARSASRL